MFGKEYQSKTNYVDLSLLSHRLMWRKLKRNELNESIKSVKSIFINLRILTEKKSDNIVIEWKNLTTLINRMID